MAELHTDIVIQILLKLPAKSLLRFKCICKSWYSLIKNPNFVNSHLNQTLISDSDRHLLLYGDNLYCAELDIRRNNHLAFSELRLPFKLSEIVLIGSCNGLICVTSTSYSVILLYNPITRSHYNVPNIPISNLSSSVKLFGFGHDSASDDYKVLRIVQGYDDEGNLKFEGKVFSLKNNLWKCVQEISIPCFFTCEVHSCLVNGVLHFIGYEYEHGCAGEGEDYLGIMLIACFDLQTENYSVLDCPPWNHDDIDNFTDLNTLELYLRELGGCLSAMKIFYVKNQANNKLYDPIMYRADYWVMKEYGKKESWVRLFSIHFNESENHWIVMPILYSKDGRKVMVHVDGEWFEWYDLASENVERSAVHGVPDEPIEPGVFVGSLVSFEDKLKSQSEKKTLPIEPEKKNVDKFLCGI